VWNEARTVEELRAATHIPCAASSDEFGVAGSTLLRPLLLGTFDGVPCFTGEIAPDTPLPDGMMTKDLRSLFTLLSEDVWMLAGRAFHIMEWNRTTLFCPRCGTATAHKTSERAKECPSCGFTQYMRIAPATIMLVWRTRPSDGQREVLLSRSPQFPKGMFSIQAGFVDAGESLEQTVEREVWEETGLRVKNVRYFGSQPWPFPNSLMVGFIAEYESGELTIDGVELEEARWCAASDRESFPQIPPRMSIARQMIDWFLAQESS
jgi:NAD+ diphosphatase